LGQFNVTFPDGSTRSVQGTTLAAAVNNAGPGAAAPGSGGGSVSVSSGGGGGGGGGSSSSSAPAGTYNTKNGTQTVQTMAQQLQAAGWGGNTNDAAAVAAAYASTTGGAVTQGSAGPTVSSGGGGGGGGSTTTDASSAQLGQIANQMQQALASGNKAAFDEAVREYNTSFGLDTQKFQASVDQFNTTQANNVAAITGTYQGAPTLAAQAQSGVMANGQPTLAAQGQNQTAANQYLSLIAGLRGPNDPIQYLRTLQGTPQGLKDIVNAAAGRYQLGGTASGEQAAPATVGGQLANMNATNPMSNPLDPLAAALPPASQIDSRAYNAMLPSQKSALWSIYEYGGPSGAMNPADAQTMYANSLPKYGGPQTGGFLSPASGGASRTF
jgi:hypothetical protein